MRKLAIITGASSGIGAAYAHQLASQQYDLWLVARREDRLVALCQALTKKWGISAEYRVLDLSLPEPIETLCQQLSALPKVDLLIHNAGFGTEKEIASADVAKQNGMIHLHVTATYRLCQAVLPAMIRHREGAIINVSSIAGFIYGANSVNYCATKAYVTNFSQGLAMEAAPHNIRVQALCPGYTYTEFHDTDEYDTFHRSQVPKKLWMSAEEVVQISLDALKKKDVVVIPGRRNQLIVFISRFPYLRNTIHIVRRLLRRR